VLHGVAAHLDLLAPLVHADDLDAQLAAALAQEELVLVGRVAEDGPDLVGPDEVLRVRHGAGRRLDALADPDRLTLGAPGDRS
jgi:hypothetical protein